MRNRRDRRDLTSTRLGFLLQARGPKDFVFPHSRRPPASRVPGLGRRGVILISSYLLLSFFLIYSSAITTRTANQTLAATHLKDRFLTMNLAQAAADQLREDLYKFVTGQVYQGACASDAKCALKWLDQFNSVATGTMGTADMGPPFSLQSDPANGIKGLGVSGNRRSVTMPVFSGMDSNTTTLGCPPLCSGRAWIERVASTAPADPLAARDVTISAQAQVGSVAKTIQAVYRVDLGVSEIFRYAYFVNNMGWFTARNASQITVNGDVRTNGDMVFSSENSALTSSPSTGEYTKISVNGDLYAAQNPDLLRLGSSSTVTGLITSTTTTSRGYQGHADPTQASTGSDVLPADSWLAYWNMKSSSLSPNPRARTARRVVSPSQPAIGPSGTPSPVLPLGSGWNSDYRRVAQQGHSTVTKVDQQFNVGQDVQPMPYLGDLALYKSLAKSYKGGHSTLKQGGTTIVDAVYEGPDGSPNTGDEKRPLVLDGTVTPLVIDGPVVVPGDVIIKGKVSGRGTIYSGRNVHVVGNVTYQDPPSLPALERDASDGTIRQVGGTGLLSNLGRVCDDGRYLAPGGGNC